MKSKIYIIISLLITIITTKELGLPSLPKYPSIYQLSTRPYLYDLSKKYGKTIRALRDIPESEFQDYKSKKFDFVWFMGVWQVGPYGVQHDRTKPSLVENFRRLLPDYTSEDAIGSPYSITDYVCNKELCPNGDSDLLWLKKKLNSLGIRLMLDFIPNHFALDSPLVKEDINYFIRAPKGSHPPYDANRYFSNGVAYGNMQYSSPWTDVGQLNYFNPKTRNLMKQRIRSAARFADGLRCDMAYIMLNDYFYGTWNKELNSWGWSKPSEEFWKSAIREAKNAYPNLVFLAEVYGDQFKTLLNLGFDYTYDKELLDRYRNGHLDNIRGWIQYTNQYSKHLCRFIENHDDNRAVSMFGGNIKRTDITALATYTLPGMKFYFQDQWYGYRNKLDVHLRRSKAESKSIEAMGFYKIMFNFINDNIFRNGDFTYLNASGDTAWRLIAYRWRDNMSNNKMLVVINYSDQTGSGRVKISDISGSGTIKLKEILSGVTYERNRDELRNNGLFVIINDFSAQIFKYD